MGQESESRRRLRETLEELGRELARQLERLARRGKEDGIGEEGGEVEGSPSSLDGAEDQDVLISALQAVSLELAAIAADHPSVASRIHGCREGLNRVVIGMQMTALLRSGDAPFRSPART